MIFKLIAALFAATAILFAALAWRLQAGPISLAFLTPYLNEALSIGNAGFRAEVEDTVLRWEGWARTLGIQAVNVRLLRGDGSLIAAVPRLNLDLSARALLEGQLAPTEIAIIGVTAILTRHADGRFDFGLVSSEGASSSGNVLALLVDQLSRPRGEGLAGRLERASILDADLTLVDERADSLWRAPQARLILWRAADRVQVDLDADLDLDGQPAKLVALGTFDPASGGLGLRIAFRDLPPRHIAERLALPDEVSALDLPVSGSIGFSLDAAGNFSAVDFDISGGAGRLSLAQLRPEPYEVRSLRLRGKLSDALDRALIEEARVELGDVVLSLAGIMQYTAERGFGFDVKGSFPTLPTDGLIAHWPPTLARDARAWIAQNIAGGKVHDAVLRARVTPEMVRSGRLPAEAITLDFAFEGLQVQYFRGFPRLTDTRGQARLNVKSLDLTMEKGVVERLAVERSRLLITGLDVKDQDAEIDIVVRGSAPEALALIDREPLRLATGLGISPAEVGGEAVVTARFRFPLEKDLELDEVDVRASAELRSVSIEKIFDRFRVSEGTLALKVDKSMLEVAGDIHLNQVPVKIRWLENFDGKAAFSSRYSLAGRLDDAGRAALGLQAGGYLSGPVPIETDVEMMRGGGLQVRGRANLTEAEIRIDQARWRKPAGVAGRGEFRMAASGERVELQSVRLEGEGFAVAGRIGLRDGSLMEAEFPELRFGKSEVALSLGRPAPDLIQVKITGRSLDLRPYFEDYHVMEEPDPGGSAGNGQSLDVEARLERVLFTDDMVLDGVEILAARRDGVWNRIEAGGALGDRQAVTLRLAPAEGRRHVRLDAGDAGRVVRALGISDSVSGGTLELKAEIRDDKPNAPVEGRLRLQDFKLVNAPLLAKILNIASFAGIGQLLTGEGIAFVRAEVPFTLEDNVLRLQDGRAWGSAMGFTGTGNVNFRQGEMALSGTIVPSYTINSLLGYIPLLGRVFTSREGEGLFGAVYQVQGPISEPKVSVNPLSALAPGILRRMFEPWETDGSKQPNGPRPDFEPSPQVGGN
ncbi:MAG: AsmA-like C-terminal domain-containing protein [Alphaproteobacteria bacterium]|nr:AsmA-like C-terminal domain-containing protein [Alphaproteobacteria bacterium]